jgi:hypothetical protein
MKKLIVLFTVFFIAPFLVQAKGDWKSDLQNRVYIVNSQASATKLSLTSEIIAHSESKKCLELGKLSSLAAFHLRGSNYELSKDVQSKVNEVVSVNVGDSYLSAFCGTYKRISKDEAEAALIESTTNLERISSELLTLLRENY